MTAARKPVVGSLVGSLLVSLLGLNPPAQAEPLGPGEVLRMTFDLQWYPPPNFPVPLNVFDLFGFQPGVEQIEPVSSYTVRLFDRGQLLGTYSGNLSLAYDLGYPPVAAAFTADSSTFTRGAPTIIDFASIRDGTIEGMVELTIASGLLDVRGVTDEFRIAQTYGDRHISAQATFGATSVEIAPVPEPSSVFLFITGMAAMIARRRGRRCAAPLRRP